MNELVQEITALSHEYGGNPDWVLAGGGNTSIKDAQWMWVKASGTRLADIKPEQFVQMERAKLDAIWRAQYPEDAEERERRALSDLMAARASGEEAKRPSVETLLHGLFPQRIVYHTHPSMVNGITCSQEGRRAMRRLFHDEALWVPTVNPGYILARVVFSLVQEYRATRGTEPRIVLMENHGLLVAGETANEIRALHEQITAAMAPAIQRRPNLHPAAKAPSADVVAAVEAAFRPHVGADVAVHAVNTVEVEKRVQDRDAFAAVEGALSPDHIVYAGHLPCFADAVDEIAAAVNSYVRSFGVPPKVVAVRGVDAFGCGKTEVKARLAAQLFLDACKVAAYAENFGGVRFMPSVQIEFIRNWEVESYREQLSTQ